MTHKSHDNVQTDIFAFLSPDDQEILKPAVQQQHDIKNRKNKLAQSSAPVKKVTVKYEDLQVNLSTCIKYDGVLTPITEYFETEEIQTGIRVSDTDERRPINTEDLRLKLAEEYGEMCDSDYVTLTMPPTSNIIVPQIHGRKRGLSLEDRHGIYASLEQANLEPKYNMYVPSADGYVYHIRNGDVYTSCSKAGRIPIAKQLYEGINFNKPLIPFQVLSAFISISKEFTKQEVEVYGEILLLDGNYTLSIPPQDASKMNVQPIKNSGIADGSIKVMEIHSHHNFPAKPSPQDDESEIGTCLYTIIGKLDEFFPEIQCRVHVNGRFISVNPSKLFSSPFPQNASSYPQVRVIKSDVIHEDSQI
ncbi:MULTISPECIES: hypothetical protein [Paenibacillus]|uniref:hypothetical protein n=1 Tax=Paenibacillus TaxID=44249 RepID=UPI0009A7BCBF|nr:MULTISPECIES: hypothetical protein [Paenibacillus]MCZ1268431.1 hypothetical protein [Paenibacillus tundrae]SLK15982.1 hypothetical protein SAMN06272722_11046 [Paenibacillus sp. RU5A]SOC74148.1 hypothetical protein SAMN05880581_11046 [Paenibacillus sp. RU26A]SOC76298.1 hypothetical protein SAMN05880586_11046 [Paenibacillus sp. RU5M]